ncbi:EAL domain-containing protein [Salinisphaera aquimarina]|uniref:EAL domain-containing protein n=1 Tax=Salinisphaera aquimarina TaxID=2094031 RepID=A0ABV7ERR2_9GAMM
MAGCARNEHECKRCEGALDFDFTMAFQPIVDVRQGVVHAYEALVRGTAGESAFEILSRVDERTLYRFDQACRVKAIEIAHALGLQSALSINFLPNAVYDPQACIQATLEAARRVGWPTDKISFEITETELVRDRLHLQNIVSSYRAMGFQTALDDFGTGFANLELLVELTPDWLKIDRRFIDGVDHLPRKQAIVDSIIVLARGLGTGMIAEGVETVAEARWLYQRGIDLQQGYLYARPAIEQLPVWDPALLEMVCAADSWSERAQARM